MSADLWSEPTGMPPRIPIISVLRLGETTTTTQLIAHALTTTNKCVGMITPEGFWIDRARRARGDMSHPDCARTLLSDVKVEVAILEGTGESISRQGLGYDEAEVALILKSSPHGQLTSEEWFPIKLMLAERVRVGGTIVLDADDPDTCRLAAAPALRRQHKHFVYFTCAPHHPLIDPDFLRAGGMAYVVRDGWLTELEGCYIERPIFQIPPASLVDRQGMQQSITMVAAVAACRAYGMRRAALTLALRDGGGNRPSNRGRPVSEGDRW